MGRKALAIAGIPSAALFAVLFDMPFPPSLWKKGRERKNAPAMAAGAFSAGVVRPRVLLRAGKRVSLL